MEVSVVLLNKIHKVQKHNDNNSLEEFKSSVFFFIIYIYILYLYVNTVFRIQHSGRCEFSILPEVLGDQAALVVPQAPGPPV